MSAVHSFERRMSEADDPEVRARVEEILVHDLGCRRVRRADVSDDRLGVDFWAIFANSTKQGIDLKARRRDWGDVLAEITSVVSEGSPGWAIDERKITDYILFLWPTSHLLLPYPLLRATVRRNLELYRERYGVQNARSSGNGRSLWQTENVAVPEGVIFRDMFGRPAPVGMPLTRPRKCPACELMHPVGTTCAGGWAPWEGDA